MYLINPDVHVTFTSHVHKDVFSGILHRCFASRRHTANKPNNRVVLGAAHSAEIGNRPIYHILSHDPMISLTAMPGGAVCFWNAVCVRM